MYDNLRYDQIMFKASHNSYERNETIGEQLTFHPDQPYNSGCLGLEFDIWRHSANYTPFQSIPESYFTVSHVTPGKTILKKYLVELKNWHNWLANKNHYPVLITLDIKSKEGGYDGFNNEIDTYLKCYFDESLIFKPGELFEKNRGYDPNASLVDNIRNHGWPKIADMRGKFIFCLSGNKDWKTEYAKGVRQRFCFSDTGNLPSTDPNIVFFNAEVSGFIFPFINARMQQGLIDLQFKNFITRGYGANDATLWNLAKNLNFSEIATNAVRNHEWAEIHYTSPIKEKSRISKRSLRNKSNNEYRTDRATHMTAHYDSNTCLFIFEQDPERDIYAIKNYKTQEYFDCTISTMSPTINDDCQRWSLIPTGGANEYYIKNVKNGEYMTKKASQLSKNHGKDEVYIIENR
ncbi:Ca2+-dependent phosphoinositide-specific phospholipase C [Flavobacterium suzhouense]|uniref:Ca2+-dependent phosphoinositide-specific phospholipase C n=1 Tax=Flavobacterium suzhouense TaxID=1529638 RepID=A0ABW5NSB3_9FLAO